MTEGDQHAADGHQPPGRPGGGRAGGGRADGGRADGGPELTVRVGRDELIIRHRYETASIVNDLMLGTWFLIGSVLFLTGPMTLGTWLFVLGSGQLLIRPIIRLSRNIYLTRVTGSRHGVVMGHSADF